MMNANNVGRHGCFRIALIALVAFALFAASGSASWRKAQESDYVRSLRKRRVADDYGSSGKNQYVHKSCDQYDGVLIIDKVDPWAAAGTVFFLYMVNFLIYAEQHNLMPWIHLDPRHAGKAYDARFHSGGLNQYRYYETARELSDANLINPDVGAADELDPESIVRAETALFMSVSNIPSEASNNVPGKPNFSAPRNKRRVSVRGNGVWNLYFHKVSPAFNYTDPICTNHTLFLLQDAQVFPGIHVCAPWAVRMADYGSNKCGDTTREERQALHIAPEPNETMHEWFGRQRRVAAPLVAQYWRPHSWLQTQIDNTNPRKDRETPCLALHIRMSDKGGRGNNIYSLDPFLEYARAYIEGGGKTVFIATDTSSVFGDIEKSWPPAVAKSVVRQEGVFLSNSTEGIFDLVNHHRSNTEALVEIYAMAKCELFVHGYSAMSEAAMYLNPSLHNFSVNLDYPLEERTSMKAWQSMVSKVLKTGIVGLAYA